MTSTTTPTRSHLSVLRGLMPARALTFREALQRAELQAARLLELSGTTSGPVPETVITGQPRVLVEHNYLPGESGVSNWQRGAWRIQLSALEPAVRCRFTLAHEYKHVLDAPFEQQIYAGLKSPGEHHPQIERICDHFAACLLMPKRLVKRAWGTGLSDPQALAAYFNVSPQAMQIRLQTLGLVDRPVRCRTGTGLIRQRQPQPYWRPTAPSFVGVRT